MLTQQEKEYIDLSIASGLGEQSILQSFLQQSGWSQEKIDSALTYSGGSRTLEEASNPYLTPSQADQKQESFEDEVEVSLPGSSESVADSSLAQDSLADYKATQASLVEHFSELEKQESIPLKINTNTQNVLPIEQTPSVVVEEKTFLPAQEKKISQESFQNLQEGSTVSPLVMAHDENGEPHSIFHLVMIFLLIFFVLVVCLVGLLFWLDIGPFSSITYTKVK